jgi:hypothetical protein
MVKHKVNYEQAAAELASALPLDVTVGKVERTAQAVLKVYRRAHTSSGIASPRNQTIYDYVISLRDVRMDEEEKAARLVEFIRQLMPEDNPALPHLLALAGASEAPPMLRPLDFNVIVHDRALAALLNERWKEAGVCLEQHAYLAATILMGSLLEGLLLARVMADPKAANASPTAPKGKDGKPRPFHEWTLGDLVDVAHSCGWMHRNVKDISQPLRDYRNLVHPWHQLADGMCPDEGSCKVCWDAVRAAVEELAGEKP